jgi:hypothetical protein
MKKNLILFLLIVIVFLYFQHRSVPNVPLPTQYKTPQLTMQINAHLGIPASTGEVWTIAKKNNSTYLINVYHNSKLIHTFFSAKAIKHDDSGTTYGTGGAIMFDGYPYTAISIHVNNGGQTGNILFTSANKKPINSATGANQS